MKSLASLPALLGVAVPVCLCAATAAVAAASPGPLPVAPAAPIPAPQDRPFAGLIHLDVDASDVERRIIRVHETLSGASTGTVLLYPKWLPGTHAPEGPIDRFSGLSITADGKPVRWTRDPVDMYAFHLDPSAKARTLDIRFEYLSPASTDVGDQEISRSVLMLEWNTVVLYPAGWFSRRIPVEAGLTLPAGWQFATALEPAAATGAHVESHADFKPVPLNTLVDSPVYAGRWMSRLDLDPDGKAPVHLNLFAERPELLRVKPEQLAPYRALVQQAYRLFGSHHYDHYDFLFSLTDQVQHTGLEHHQSSEDGSDPRTFIDWDQLPADRDLLPHEYTHSWNGKFRRPADLWTPNFNVPMRNSLLWVYEGQTEYWGNVLTARAGLRTPQQSLDHLALLAAYYQNSGGRDWRPLQDTTGDEIINPRRPQSWRDRQRFEDYYDEGMLVWLDADTLIRERSGGKRSLDDFARAFFGIDDGSFVTVTYTFDDVVKALNAVEPYDWAAFLRARLDTVGGKAPLDGLARGGYRLVYTDTPSAYEKLEDGQDKRVSLQYSIGVVVDADDQPGTLQQVLWGSPAFKAGLTRGTQVLAVNGQAYSADRLRDAIEAAHDDASAPIELMTRNGDQFAVEKIDYHGGLRYPHLERDATQPARLDDILKPRP